ncbi:MAG TPA: hypothetical protein VFG69_14105, partial [Nannocystaceae bacterium]|nr:hypothetical protein [Nannocystaceae bacterium]
LIGRSLDDGSEPVHAVAVVDLGPPRPRVHLRVRSETGVRDRTIEDDDCAALAEITAIVVAIAIDPSASLREPEPVPPPPSPKPAPKPAAPVQPPTPDEPRLQGLVRAAGGIGWGAVPGFAPTLGLVAGLRWRHARLELGAEHWFMQQARFDRAPSVGVDVRLTTAVLHGCWVPSVKRVEFPLCGGAAIGSLRGDGVGVPRAGRKRLLWSAGHVAAAVLFAPIRALAFGLDARFVVPFSRNRFTLDDYGVIHRTSAAGVVLSAVVEGRFP